MSAAIDLMRALLGRPVEDGEARAALTLALEAEIDPLRWCAIHLGLGEGEAMRRAAAWADLAFYDAVPRLAHADLQPDRLEMLANVQMFRVQLLDREVGFAAPDFFGVLRLQQARQRDPGLRMHICLVPANALRSFLAQAAAPALVDGARQNLARRWPYAAAQLDLTRAVRRSFTAIVIILVGLLVSAPFSGQMWVLPIWVALVALPVALRVAVMLAPITPSARIPPFVDPADLPIYSVMVPLRDEANMVSQLFAALKQINYPSDKLDILLVVEQRSSYTVEAVRRHLGDVRFTLVEVPDTQPRTKPKALDFALPLCRGEYVVVFDAEDRPEPDQLLKSVSQFRATPDISCLQARLVIANGGRSPLSALFAGEYAALFAVTLPALARWGFLVPLGGTSNHFRIRTLRELGGWDAFNVTEDAHLGVRLTRRGLKTMVSQSWTLEDAPDRLGPWLGQRTRWMKGWMQTYLVHMRRPRRLLEDIGWQGFVTFQVIVLGMILAPLLHAGFFVYLGAMSLTDTPIWSSADQWTMICLLVLGLGHGAAIANNILGLHRTGQSNLLTRQLALPIYWLLIAWATLKALVELLRRPFHWFKTPHYAAVRTPRGTIEVAPVRETGP